MALTGIGLSASILIGVDKPIDAKFGPFADVATANSEIGSTLRYKGLTVGIVVSGAIVEYWYKDGILNADLVAKIPSLIWSNITGTPTTISGYGITDAVLSSRTLTINGTSYDLSADRSWTIATTKARRHEFVSADSTDYCGTAPEGSSESATVWTIKKLVIASSGTPTITTATNVAWTNRLTSTYI